MGQRLSGKRIVVTDAGDFMGPAVTDLFTEEGAEVIADRRDLRPLAAASELIAEAGHIDVLVANLSIRGHLPTRPPMLSGRRSSTGSSIPCIGFAVPFFHR